ncbi:MAG: serine/threonine protein kinase, partial [Candidatus Hydrogenedentes bacterium]|nr:serine/threonine protein kinase [Candidatus Hydrogenedentota bacterium]
MKPSNIIMLNNGQIKVADFGIARVSDSNLTQEGAMIGTPHYMSPEQFMGHKVDARSDLFSVGIILYELITGEKPFAGEALSAVMHNVIKTTPVAPHELNFAANECLSKVIMKALNKDPNQRYQNGSTMAAALRESLKEAPDPAVTLVGAIAPRQPVAETIVASGGVAETVLGTGGPGETLTAGVKQNAPAVGAPSIRKASPSNESVSEKPSRRRALALAGAGVLAVAAIAVATYAMMDRSFFSDANVTLILQEATASLDDIGAVGADRLKDRPLTDYHAKLGSGTVLFSRSNGEPKQVEISDGG